LSAYSCPAYIPKSSAWNQWSDAMQTQTGKFRQALSLESSPDYEFQPLLIYDMPQLLERTDSTNDQLGSNLHNQSRTEQLFT